MAQPNFWFALCSDLVKVGFIFFVRIELCPVFNCAHIVVLGSFSCHRIKIACFWVGLCKSWGVVLKLGLGWIKVGFRLNLYFLGLGSSLFYFSCVYVEILGSFRLWLNKQLT